MELQTSIKIMNESSPPSSAEAVCISINRPILRCTDVYAEIFTKSTKKVEQSPSKFNLSQVWTPLYHFLSLHVPIIAWLPRYSPKNSLGADLWSGTCLAMAQISDGLAFGWLTDMAPVTGLYMSIFPVLVFALLGRSRQLSIGTFPVISVVCSHVLDSMTPESAKVASTVSPIELFTSLAMLVGLIQLGICLLRLEALFSLFSEAILCGFLSAMTLHIFAHQMFPLFGIHTNQANFGSETQKGNARAVPFKFPRTFSQFIKQFSANWNPTTLALATGTIFLIFLWKALLKPYLKRHYPKMKYASVPVNLLLIILFTLITHHLNLHTTHRIELIPSDFTSPFHLSLTLPNKDLWMEVLPTAALVTFVTFSGGYTATQQYAKKHEYSVSPNQAMLALGVANVLSSLFHCYPVCPSAARSKVQERIGQKSQIASLISVVWVALFAHFLYKYFASLPLFVLSAIIISATVSILRLQIPKIKSILYSNSIADISTLLASFFGVLLLGAKFGLIIGISVALLFLVRQIFRPNMALKVSIPETEYYIDLRPQEKYPQTQQKVLVFEISGPLIYLDVEHLKASFTNLVIKTLKSLQKGKPDLNALILDCEAISFVDRQGAKVLAEFETELHQQFPAVSFCLAACCPNLLACLKNFGFFNHFNPNRCFLTVHDAVVAMSNVLLN